MFDLIGKRRLRAGLAQWVCLSVFCAIAAVSSAEAQEARTSIPGLGSAAEERPANPWFLAPLTNAVQQGADEDGQVSRPWWQTTTTFLNGLGSALMADAPDWLNRTSVNWNITEAGGPGFELASSQLVRPPLGLVGLGLLQGNLAHSDQDLTRGSFGFAYRRLLDDRHWLIGVNSFYDYGWEYEHDRMSFGGQLSSGIFEVTTNYYVPTSANDSEFANTRVMSGYDFEANLQVPYLPWASAYAYGDGWYSVHSDADVLGSQSAGLRLSPLPFLNLSGGVVDNGSEQPVYTVGFRVNIAFGDTEFTRSTPLIDDQPFRWRDMRADARQPVRRQNVMRLIDVGY